jgi:hypothetical protein
VARSSDFRIGQPAVVIDCDVHELPAGDALPTAADPSLGLAGAAAADAVADITDAAELLDVDVDELTGAERS